MADLCVWMITDHSEIEDHSVITGLGLALRSVNEQTHQAIIINLRQCSGRGHRAPRLLRHVDS